MREAESVKWLTVVVSLGCLSILTGIAMAESEADMATLRAAGTSAMWIAQPGTGATVLTVKGGAVQIRQAVRAGASPVVSLTRPDGTALPDGTYAWELSESFAGVNDRVWDPANGRTTAAQTQGRQRVAVSGRVQRDSFTVKKGLVADTNIEEAAAK